MAFRPVAVFTCVAVLVAGLGFEPVAADTPKPAFKKLQSSNKSFKFRKKSGYWVECSYSALGENCYYVYATVKTAGGATKVRRLKADKSTLKRKSGYWVECRYTGLGQECSYVYARVRKPVKS